MERQVLFSTPHGSHLYGLAHAGSDRDTYTVVSRLPHVAHNGTRSRYAKQRISGAEDTFVIDLSTFMRLCDKGVPQALEAMWSRTPTADLLGSLRGSYRASTAVLPTYLRTIRHFARAGDFKRKRHALRLGLNARDIAEFGFFNPTLTLEQAALITRLAEGSAEDVEKAAVEAVWA